MTNMILSTWFAWLLTAVGTASLVPLAFVILRQAGRRNTAQARRREPALADNALSRALVDAAKRNFGRRLRDHRERHQITLDAIATATKIKPSVLAELERGEVSTWPSGIFRR